MKYQFLVLIFSLFIVSFSNKTINKVNDLNTVEINVLNQSTLEGDQNLDLLLRFEIINNTDTSIVIPKPMHLKPISYVENKPEFFSIEYLGCTQDEFVDHQIKFKKLDDYITMLPGSKQVFEINPVKFDAWNCTYEANSIASIIIRYKPNEYYWGESFTKKMYRKNKSNEQQWRAIFKGMLKTELNSSIVQIKIK